MTDLNKATFLASIAPIQTGISTGGDGMRVKLDIPETDFGEAAKLLGMRGKVLEVTIKLAKVEKHKSGVNY